MLGTFLQLLAFGLASYFAFVLGGMAGLGLVLCGALMFLGVVVERMSM
jgi:hypothetical protein|tara:strand:- start:732 stop:875 length:144 start_codon:yes stop_codon:yes gene_type:complete